MEVQEVRSTAVKALLLLALAFSLAALAGCSRGNDALAEDEFRALLTLGDVQAVLISEVALNSEFRDLKNMALSVDPKQVVAVDSWYGLIIVSEDGFKGMTFQVVDFDSQQKASDHFEKAKSETPGIVAAASPIGDAYAQYDIDDRGLGGLVMFIKGDLAVSLHTSRPDGQQALVDLEGLNQLARAVETKLP